MSLDVTTRAVTCSRHVTFGFLRPGLENQARGMIRADGSEARSPRHGHGEGGIRPLNELL